MRLHTCVVIALVIAASACQERAPVTPNDEAERQPQFLVSIDPSVGADLTLEEERAEEQRAIDEVVSLVPEANRAGLRRALESGAMPYSSGDPEVAKHFSRIASLRINQVKRMAAEERARKEANPRARVRIAISESPQATKARAVVIRQPGDDGIPTVLLAASATEQDLELALRAAVRSAQKNGAAVKKQLNITVKGRAAPKAQASAFLTNVLQMVRSHPVHELPGIGRVRYTDVLVPLPSR